jgi:hypothetical protein
LLAEAIYPPFSRLLRQAKNAFLAVALDFVNALTEGPKILDIHFEYMINSVHVRY